VITIGYPAAIAMNGQEAGLPRITAVELITIGYPVAIAMNGQEEGLPRITAVELITIGYPAAIAMNGQEAGLPRISVNEQNWNRFRDLQRLISPELRMQWQKYHQMRPASGILLRNWKMVLVLSRPGPPFNLKR